MSEPTPAFSTPFEWIGGEERIHALRTRLARIPFLDPIDLRFRNRVKVPVPSAKAVMFCLMDVSGSMTEHMKDLAKRFFMLLYLFLTRRYRSVELVFIRHTHEAHEVDEQTFFYSTETGGTVVSTALEEMLAVLADRYPVADWNIYAAQASDGDNMISDNTRAATLLREQILPACQYFAYIEVAAEHVTGHRWWTLDELERTGERISPASTSASTSSGSIASTSRRRSTWPPSRRNRRRRRSCYASSASASCVRSASTSGRATTPT